MTRIADLLPAVLAEPLPDAVTNRRVNWIEVARTDVADARHSVLLWSLAGTFAVLALLVGGSQIILHPMPSDVSFGLALTYTRYFLIRWFVPLAALVVGALAVVSEREAGSLRMLLGLPITRRDVVLGKLLGRTFVFSVMLLVGLALLVVESWYLYTGFDLSSAARYVGGPLLLGWLFVGIGVGFSALFRSRARALGASASVFALTNIVWHVVPDGVLYLRTGEFPDEISPLRDLPAWFIFIGNVNPINGLFALFTEWTSGYRATLSYEWYSIEAPGPLYLQPEFLLAVMLLWAVVPLVVGTWRFSRGDLG